MAYNGSIQLSAGITPLNGGDFKLADAKDVYYTDEQSVKGKLDSISGEISAAVGNISSFDYIIPENGLLPTSGAKGYIYLIPITGGISPNIYKEYIWITDKFELIGDTLMDLSGYLQSSDIADWAKADTKPAYTASEVGALPDTTSIPSSTSELTNDSGFITSDDIPNSLPASNVSISGQTITVGDSTLTVPTVPDSYAPTDALKNVLSDWNLTDTTKDDFIKNKPTIPSIEGLASREWVNQQGFIKLHLDISNKLDITTYENNNITIAASLNDLNDALEWEDEE